MCDDLNDYVGGFDGHPQVQTPSMEKLAASGMTFTNAQCNYPACVPSRNSLIHGIYPHNASSAWMPWSKSKVFSGSKTMMTYFKENGYQVIGTGKIDHYKNPNEWSKYYNMPDYGPFWKSGDTLVAHPKVLAPFRDIGSVDGSFGSIESALEAGKESHWHYAPHKWKAKPKKMTKDPTWGWMTPDKKNALLAKRLLSSDTSGLSEPFFLSVGFIRPHTPLHVEEKHFDAFPLEKLKLNPIKKDDGQDTHLKDLVDRKKSKGFRYYNDISKSYGSSEKGLKVFLQAYLASIRAVDANIGLVLAALEDSPYKDNTIVVLTSDHGWQMGEKDWLFKGSPWEESTRVPMIVRVPGMTKGGSQCTKPVSLVDIYPTLSDLCSLKGSTIKNKHGKPLDGHSMRPFLSEAEKAQWSGPDAALTLIRSTQFQKGDESTNHFSLRSEGFRYIRYSNGEEELYNHTTDPHEWKNLAYEADYSGQKKSLRESLNQVTGFEFSFKN